MDEKQNSDKCELCKVQFNNVHDMTSHYQGKKHIRLATLHKDVVCGVFITGFTVGRTKEELLHYFSQFGAISKTWIGPKLNYIIIIFENEKDAQTVLNSKHCFDGMQLVVEKRNPPIKNVTDRSQEALDEETMEKLKVLQEIPKLDEQINTFVDVTTPNIQQMIPLYHAVNIDLLLAMRSVFPLCVVYPFGSTTTSLQFKNSDIDIFVNIVNKAEDDADCLKQAKKGLHRSHLFHNILLIPAAKIPIIKCVHNKTGIKCDVSFKNNLGVKNSGLIQYYLSLDSKLRIVMLVIKFWAKIQGISGRNHLFTNYSIVMMFLFYLQRKYSFPSVFILQTDTQPTDPQIIWNANISPTDTHAKMCKLEAASKMSILKEFFSFYSDFSYDTHIICPYLGETIDKNMFSNVDEVREEFSLYKMHIESIEPLKYDRPICLQDPFEHNFNTCSIIFPNILENFVMLCKLAVEILSENNEKNMLYLLFSKRLEKNSLHVSAPDPQNYLICIKMQNKSNRLQSRVILPQSDPNYKRELMKLWFDEVHEYVCNVFEEVFKFRLTPANNYNSKNSRLDKQKDVHDDIDCRVYRAECFIDLWQRRKVSTSAIDDDLDKCETTLARDILISDYLCKNKCIRPPSPSLFECEITFNCLEEPASCNIELVRITSYKKMFKSFCKYIIVKLPQWFEVHENELTMKL